MHLIKAAAAGATISLLASYLLRSLEGGLWDFLSIIDFEVAGYRIFWSWPFFAGATAICWLLQKLGQV